MHFNWLHFTDLHCGMREDRWLWDTVHERLRRDLAILQPRCGPWDLILFTGDLTDRGTRAQFDELDARLTRLGDCIAAGQDGRQPILLAVPGNHDLQRPPSDDEGLSVLAAWRAQPQLPPVFWDKPDAVARKTIDTAFAEYRAWWERRVAPQLGRNGLVDLRLGTLPGDFSATLERDGCRLGLLGLNTAALQLTAEDYEHRLALHSLQFSAACGAGGLDWAQRHHACLLMSHHPPAWLDTESRAHLEGQITDDGRFAVHLCGHLHEPYRLRSAVNANPEKFLFQGRSLFGLEHFGDRQERLHGYTAGRINLGGPQAGTLVLWPRRGELSGGELRINVDSNDLPVEATDTGPIPFKLPRPCGGVSAVPMPQATPTGAAPVPVAAGCATGAIPAVPAPGSAPVPLSPPLDDAFARALAKIIDQTLAVPAALLLREALRTGLAGPGGTTGERLCALGQEGAVTVLFGALVACLRQSPRGEGGRELRVAARRLLGWLLMRCVHDEWSTVAPGAAADWAVSARVEVGSEAGAEILWAHRSGVNEPPDFRVIGPRLVGRHSLRAATEFPEGGWEDPTIDLDAAKAALWVALLGEQAPEVFGGLEDQRLLDAFIFDRQVFKGSRFYLTVSDQGDVDPLGRPAALAALKAQFKLPVLVVTRCPEDRFISIGETRLQDRIKQCLKILKEHGDD